MTTARCQLAGDMQEIQGAVHLAGLDAGHVAGPGVTKR